jgi:serine protease
VDRRVARVVGFALAGAGLFSAVTATASATSSGQRHIGIAAQEGRVYTFARGHAGLAAGQAKLKYYGGTGSAKTGVEVHPKVYLVFWGSQWGTPTTSGSDLTFTVDPANAAPYVQDFLRGLFGSKDTWSTSTTQYCQGIAKGSTSCPTSATFVKHATASPLAGVWADGASAAPANATAQQIGQEADAAAVHFGNTTPASNRSVQYVIASATQMHPDNYPAGGWCAWHDFTRAKDVNVVTPRGNVAFTNLPYISDTSVNCGQGFVNTPGLLDGWSIVEGHEYAETVTDIFPQAPVGATDLTSGGWFEPVNGENGDKCAWGTPGTPGGAANITLSTGTFAVQSLWSNNLGTGGGCAIFYQSATNQHG